MIILANQHVCHYKKRRYDGYMAEAQMHETSLKSTEQIHEMGIYWGSEWNCISSWLLYRTAITAYLTKLVQDGKTVTNVRSHSLSIARKMR
ncbi:hypothetical protein [Saccharococcus caldoxylosilyticus]|jgi:hypothetical protein|uniref:hypothetical protein n=1 Tax=Saccharococcus caldoxylosilyticus TaxID=81408 RepID=UPI001FCC9D73|nr:hypothetical protein [Parageobacillus caldoxylosilyticus]